RAVLKPLVGVRRDAPGDAAVLKPLDTSDKGLAIACGANPRYGMLDPAAVAFGTPFISGKDSLNNEYRVGDRTLSIPPTLLISALSVVPDVRRAVSMDLKKA